MASAHSQSHHVTCLGVGEGWPCTDRRHSAYLYQFGNEYVLIDCGDGTTSAYAALGLGPDALDRIILSHQHSDHVGGLSLFIQGLWLEKRRRPLTLHAPSAAIPAIQAWFNATLLFTDLIGFPILWEPLVPHQPFGSGPLRITPLPTRHLESLRARFISSHPDTSFESFSFLLEDDSRRAGHTADIGRLSDLEPLLAQPLHLLLCEAAHVDPDQLLSQLQPASIGRILFIHLDRELWANRAAFETRAQQHLPDSQPTVAIDGLSVPF